MAVLRALWWTISCEMLRLRASVGYFVILGMITAWISMSELLQVRVACVVDVRRS